MKFSNLKSLLTKIICVSSLTSLILFVSGCGAFTPVRIVEGTDDYIPLQKGTVINQVPLNITGETQMYDIKLVKDGAFFSTDAQAEVLQARQSK